MEPRTRTRMGISALIYTMVNAVLFGVGLIVVLSVPALRAALMVWIPVVVLASLVLAVPVSWWLAPRLRARNWQRTLTWPSGRQPIPAPTPVGVRRRRQS